MTSDQSQRVSNYLQHILQAISRIQDYVASKDLNAFHQDRLVQDAVIRNFEIIGEAANKILLADAEFAHGLGA